LDSCENPEQVKTTEKLFNLYIEKWGKENNLTPMITNFEKEKNSKKVNVRKIKSFLPKFSRFFLF
jgi:hypothetical protein